MEGGCSHVVSEHSLVPNDDGLCVRTLRPAVNYFNDKADLAANDIARPADGAWSLWNATLAETEAANLENAETSPAALGGVPRTKAGEIEYWTGSKKARLFTKNQRDREDAFYSAI